MTEEKSVESMNFIEQIVESDLNSGKISKVISRFPPEPNGYLHIGHAKSICLNFGLPLRFGGRCHLRFDDTNPTKEDTEYVDSIMNDVRWLGFDWGEHLYYASDYFQQLYDWAIYLIKEGKAYVCELSGEEIRQYRGTLTEPGQESPYRNRSIEENLALFQQMKDGEIADGQMVLRAKVDMSSPNLNMRDPVMYRVLHAHHHRTGDDWCIYPMYDFTHGQSDAIEGITHSVCTLEFEDHRPLYDWFIEQLPVPRQPHQYEFARLNLTNTILSKRKLIYLVQHQIVKGWDDPRMPTLAGMRRRGYPASAIRQFCDRIGVNKMNSMVDFSLLHFFVREVLNKEAHRVMAVLDPIKLVITNYPEGQEELLAADNNPEDLEAGQRQIRFQRELFIERSDFMEAPPSKYFRLSPGREVRLKHAYYVTCQQVIKNEQGEIVELHCTYDPESRGGGTSDGRKVKGTLHWVPADAATAEVRLYDHLFSAEDPGSSWGDDDPGELLNPESEVILTQVRIEDSLKNATQGQTFQFMRQGYFVVDADFAEDHPVFNRVVTLKDSWAKQQKRQTN